MGNVAFYLSHGGGGDFAGGLKTHLSEHVK